MGALNKFTPTTHDGQGIPTNISLEQKLPVDFIVLILGAGEGIGEHIAYAYARAGARTIILTARRLPNLEKVQQEIQRIIKDERLSPMNVEIASCDIASASSMGELAKFVQSKTGGNLDCVIPNAAYAPPVKLRMHLDEPEDVQRAFDVNAMGTFHAVHYFVPMLLSSKGGKGAKQFIAVGSMASAIRKGHIANMGYCVSKMAQTRMIEYVAEQYSSEGLWACCVHPGAVNTEMARSNTPESFLPYLIDDVGLCGAYCVWLSKMRIVNNSLGTLNGRFVSATWDAKELVGQMEQIEKGDSLKFAMAL